MVIILLVLGGLAGFYIAGVSFSYGPPLFSWIFTGAATAAEFVAVVIALREALGRITGDRGQDDGEEEYA